MNILRDEQVVAIDDVVVGLRSESAHLTAVADQAAPSKHASRASDRAERLRRMADELAGIIAELGDVAHAPSDEAMLLDQAATVFRSAISSEMEAFVSEELAASDARLRDIAREARPMIKHTRAGEIVDALIGGDS